MQTLETLIGKDCVIDFAKVGTVVEVSIEQEGFGGPMKLVIKTVLTDEALDSLRDYAVISDAMEGRD